MEMNGIMQKHIQKCKNILELVEGESDVRARVAILTTFNQLHGSFDIAVWAEQGASHLVMEADGNREVSEELRSSGGPVNIKARSGKDYFMKMSPLKAREKELLITNGYQPNELFFYAIPIPPKSKHIDEAFFLIAADAQEQSILDKKLNNLLEVFV